MSSRVTRGMILVAVFSALLLALASSVTARLLWTAHEQAELRAAADSLAEAIGREARENGYVMADAAREALRESTLPGFRAEVWAGSERVAEIDGVADSSFDGSVPDPWMSLSRDLPLGQRLVVAAPPDSARALRVFSFSLAIAAPVCLVGAWLAGRLVAGRVTRPLRDLQARIRALPGLDPLPPPGDRRRPRRGARLGSGVPRAVEAAGGDAPARARVRGQRLPRAAHTLDPHSLERRAGPSGYRSPWPRGASGPGHGGGSPPRLDRLPPGPRPGSFERASPAPRP